MILEPDLKAEGQEKLQTKIKKFITEAEGEVLEVKEGGKKELAFPVAKKKSGFFWWLTLTASGEKISGLRQKLALENEILRYLLTVKGATEPVSPAPKSRRTKRPPSLALRRAEGGKDVVKVA